MRYFVKSVASLVIAIIAIAPALPALPATPCGQPAQSMACCGPHCPMMFRTMTTPAGSSSSRALARTACCTPSPRPITLAILLNGPQNSLDPAIGHTIPVEAILPFFRVATSGSPLPGRNCTRRLQAVLCTFLI